MRREPRSIEEWEPIFEKLHYQIPKIVRRSGMSQRTFQRNFKAKIGMTLRDAIKKCRFKNAPILVRLGYTNPKIAQKLGYADAVHFCHAFKKRFHCSPQSFAPKWRRGHKKLKC